MALPLPASKYESHRLALSPATMLCLMMPVPLPKLSSLLIGEPDDSMFASKIVLWRMAMFVVESLWKLNEPRPGRCRK